MLAIPLLVGILYVTPNSVSLDLSKNKQATIYLTPRKEFSPSQDLSRGICYSRQIASARVHGWQRVNDHHYWFPTTITASHPGYCEMWFKAGPDEVMVKVFVQR